MSPEWSDFKILIALAAGGSVAGAARELGVDSSTVSRRLAALEESIGARLLVRGGRDFAWTLEGRAALAAAETMAQAVNEATRVCTAAKLDAAGAVRVSVPPTFVTVLITKLLPQVRERFPLLKLELNGDFVRRDVARGEVDIALRMARPTEPDLIGKRAVEVGWCVYTSTDYTSRRGCPTTRDALRDHALVLYNESMNAVEPLRWLEDYKGSEFVRVDHIQAAMQLVSGGAGIAVMPALVESTPSNLVRVFPDPVVHNAGWLVYHETARDTARVRAAVDILLQFFADEADWFRGLHSCTR